MDTRQHLLDRFYNCAEFSRELALWLRKNLIDLSAVLPHAGAISIIKVNWQTPSRFDLQPDGGEPAVVCEAYDAGLKGPIDLVGWPIGRPDLIGTALGIADGLGIDQIINPATYHLGRPLPVHRTAVGWLMAGCRGCVFTNDSAARRHLQKSLGQIVAQDAGHGRQLARLLGASFDPQRILAPLPKAA